LAIYTTYQHMKPRNIFPLFFLLFFSSITLPHEGNAQEKPNVLWISVEDLSPRLAAYGDSTVSTPNIDRLAKEGVVYEHVYTTAGVCSPARNAIITGRYQTSNGGHNMRTIGNTYPEKTGLPKSYNSVPPHYVKCFPEYLRAEEYYTSNNVKTDYQFEAPVTVWDEVSETADWQKRGKRQPFFTVINFTTTHESQVWKRDKNQLRVDPKTVPVPPYYPDNTIIRHDIARHYSNVSELDDQIGEVLKKLEKDGILDKTIIFFWGDHGDGLPFYKREVYKRGLHVPLIIRHPNKAMAGTRNTDMISAIDFGPTVLSLAGISTPPQMHGRAFLGQYKGESRTYIFGARDRVDSEYDRVRSVMNKKYQYIRNFYPQRPLYMNVEYRKQQPIMQEILRLHEAGELNQKQAFWFKETKAEEELYDLELDPFQLSNIVHKKENVGILEELRFQMDKWLIETNDLGRVPEKELIKMMWNGSDSPPITENPTAEIIESKLFINCKTLGASIGYREKGTDKWHVYTSPISINKPIEIIAHRIGYEPSETMTFK
jgi:N-sulfoglucosamine sulfohydrolase